MSRYPQIIINLRPEQKEALKAQAMKERRTISEVVRYVLADYLAAQNNNTEGN